VPALARRAAHVVMLQRSPTYVLSLGRDDSHARRLFQILPAAAAARVVRLENIALTAGSYALARRRPALAKRVLRRAAARQLPPGFDVDRHFGPSYDPWDQRLCIAADGDLFAAIRSGKASVVTDRIDSFTDAGLRLASGAELEADLVVTATGLRLEL